MSLDKYVGRKVRVTNDNTGGQHPIEKREIVKGDILFIFKVDALTGWLYWYGHNEGGYVISHRYVELIEETVAVVASECTCVQLLFGHSFGCPLYKAL